MFRAKVVPKNNPSLTADFTRVLWSCSLFGDQSEIEIYMAKTGEWKTIATINCVADFDAEDIAAFIVQAVTERQNAWAGNEERI